MSQDSKTKILVDVFLLSDSTGETVHGLCRAVMAQFETVEPSIHVWTLVNQKRQIDQVLRSVKDPKKSLIMYTLVDPNLIIYLEEQCKNIQITYISILDPILTQIKETFNVSMCPKPGHQHHMNQEYFDRIAAMEFTLAHDDGLGLHNIHDSEVVLVGASRTSKTPTTIYLANRGVKAANIPYVQGIPLPIELENLPPQVLVVGLTRDARHLSHIRKTRMTMLDSRQHGSSYDDFQRVKDEVRACKEYCESQGWQMIDVTNRSIEESAAAIMVLLQKHLKSSEFN